jgi:prepilin-type N-terminal cleavage/methylation domain-containing protein
VTRALARGQGAFTLIELMISVSIGAIILGAGYVCMNAGVESRRTVSARTEAAQTARAALDLIARDLRAAVPLSREFEFLGMRRMISGADADNVDFSARNYTPRKPREPDYCEVSYFLEADEKTGLFTLFRRRDPTPDPLPLEGGSREEIARNVAGLRFEYYDGIDWYDDWGDPTGQKQSSALAPPNMSGMPEAVRVTIEIDAEPAKTKPVDEQATRSRLALQTVARLELTTYFGRQTVSTNNASSTGGGQ